MAGPKPKRADFIKSICEVTRINYEGGTTNFSNKQLRELTLWIQQARKIISDISAASRQEAANAD